ncbi:MAG: hypothetical protein ACTTKO_02245 [Candidatus Limimorpha sp.]
MLSWRTVPVFCRWPALSGLPQGGWNATLAGTAASPMRGGGGRNSDEPVLPQHPNERLFSAMASPPGKWQSIRLNLIRRCCL